MPDWLVECLDGCGTLTRTNEFAEAAGVNHRHREERPTHRVGTIYQDAGATLDDRAVMRGGDTA